MRKLPIQTCFECPYYDHSGGFTPGGAIPLCDKVKAKNKYSRRKLPFTHDEDTGKRTYDGTIPTWCPLPKN